SRQWSGRPSPWAASRSTCSTRPSASCARSEPAPGAAPARAPVSGSASSRTTRLWSTPRVSGGCRRGCALSPEPAAGEPAIALAAGERLVALEWHRLRRRREDPVFARANLKPGLAAGAALEVDLVATADGDLVCLHELPLDEETTGHGPVAVQPSAAVLALRQRDAPARPPGAPARGLAPMARIAP